MLSSITQFFKESVCACWAVRQSAKSGAIKIINIAVASDVVIVVTANCSHSVRGRVN